MGLYEVPLSVSLLGFGMGTMLANFHMCGIIYTLFYCLLDLSCCECDVISLECKTNIHTHDTHHLFNCTYIRTTLSPLDLWTDPAGVSALLARWTENLAGRPQAGRSDSSH